MNRPITKSHVRTPSRFGRRLLEKFLRPSFETLEDRLMLDGGGAAAAATRPPDIVVGRTLSSYTVGGVVNNQETITYTVYNEQADPETGVLLTTTLGAGVSFASATPLPDIHGQDLAWSLGTIPGYDRASVTLTVNLASPTPATLDSGAHVSATLDAAAVSNITPAATLRAGNVDPTLLAATPDANSTDPFIQEEAAKLDYDPQNIFDFLHTQIGYNSYTGSVRGARGTLWSGAGNTLDVASLGVALMRASGIPAQYAQGTLSTGQAQSLILTMFPPSFQTAGYIPAGTSTADPANDSQLVSETESHYWFEFNIGSGMTDADPVMAGATIGQSLTSATGRFAAVPDSLREKTEVQLVAEITSAGLLGSTSGDTTVLDQTFNDVDLVGHPLSFGNLVSGNAAGFIFSATTYTYTPYVSVGDDAYPNPSTDPIITGTSYQEMFSNFPFVSSEVTGLFLNVTLSGPQGPAQIYNKTLVDNVGYNVRQNGGTPSVSGNPAGSPSLSATEVWSMSVQATDQDPRAATTIEEQVGQKFTAVAQENTAGQTDVAAQTLSQALIGQTRAYLAALLGNSASLNDILATQALVAAYAARPRITVISANLTAQGPQSSQTGVLSFEADLLADSVFVVVAPGQSDAVASGFRTLRGILEDAAETNVFPPPSQTADITVHSTVSAITVAQAAAAQNIPMITLTSDDPGALDALAISSVAKARIATALRAGLVVLVPAKEVIINGTPTLAWWQRDPTTGETTGVGEDGSHNAFIENVGLLVAGLTTIAVVHAAAGAIDANIVFSICKLSAEQQIEEPEIAPGVHQHYGSTRQHVLFEEVREVVDFVQKNSPGWDSIFVATFTNVIWYLYRNTKLDPPVAPALVAAALPLDSTNLGSQNDSVPASAAAGPVAGAVPTAGLAAAGNLSASWKGAAASAFLASTLTAGAATVVGAGGAVIGSGAVALAAAALVPVMVSGSVGYHVQGTGHLSFYDPTAVGLAVGADWNSYAAMLSGGVTLTLTTDALTLNGQTLPSGTYTITSSAATLAGSGPSSSPDFAGTVALNAAGATVNVPPNSSGLSVGGAPLDAAEGATLAGYTGNLTVTSTGEATLSGSATAVLQVRATPTTLTTDQNTGTTFHVAVQTSLAATYQLSVDAPLGWQIETDATGNVTATPAQGTQAGTYPIKVLAQSTTDPALEAQTVVLVSVTSTSSGMTLSVQPTVGLTVPVDGAQAPTGFQAVVQNTGPAADSYTLSFSSPPAGFSYLLGPSSLTVPAGQTGMTGIYLVPAAGIPAPGTRVTFTVTATSASNPAITQTVTETFTVPAIDGVTVTNSPATLSTTPGTPVTDTITLTNVGNVDENAITLSSTASAGLAVTGLPAGKVSLAVGQSVTETVTLTPDPATPLNGILNATITASFGPAGSPVSQAVTIPTQVVAPGVQPVSDAAIQAGNTPLGNRLNQLSIALTTLFQNPSDPVARSQATANLDSLITLVTNDPFLARFATALTNARAAILAAASPADVTALLNTLGTALAALAHDVADENAHAFTLSLTPDRQIVQPAAPEAFALVLQNNGTATTTYDLSVNGLPAGVTANFSSTTVTLAPGQSISGASNPATTLTLSEAGTTLIPANFTVTATAEGADDIALTTPGLLTLRDPTILVAAVATNPGFTNPGGMVDVTARIQAAVNAPTAVSAAYTVTDSSGTLRFASSSVPVNLAVANALTTVDLGRLDTTGFAMGVATITVTLRDSAGALIPAASANASLLIGVPLTASLTTTPNFLPTGLGTVTTTLHAHSQQTFPSPLTLLGQVPTSDDELSTVLYQNNLAYEVGANGIAVIDTSDPANPRVLNTFAQDTVVKGGYNIAKIVGNDLLVATNVSLNSSGFNFIVYDLTNPTSPTLVSNTDIPFRFLSDMYVLGNVALFPIQEFDFYPAGADTTYFAQSSNVIALDISDLAHPRVVGRLFPSNDPHPQGGAVILNSQVAYTVSSTETGGDTSTGTGDLRILNIANPSAPTLVRDLNIPGTETLTNITLQGNRALVVGSSGGLLQPFDFGKTAGLTGNVTLTVLDVSDPNNPAILGNTLVTEATTSLDATLPSARRDLADLGNGLFALSNVLEGGKPALLLIDASDPSNIIVSAVQTPELDNGLTVSGSTLFVGTPTGLTTYQIHPLVSAPVTVSVQVPKDAANLNLVPGSFDKPPTQILHGVAADTYIWTRHVAFGNQDLSFSWQTTLGNVHAGDTPVVTLGATIALGDQGTTDTVTLPGTAVTGVPILSLTPATRAEPPGGSATYDVRLENPTSSPVTYQLSVQGLTGVTPSLAGSVLVAAQGTVDVPLTLTSTAGVTPVDLAFTVVARFTRSTSDGTRVVTDAQGTASGTLTIAGTPIPAADATARGVVVTLNPGSATAGQGTPATYTVRVTNTGSSADTFDLAAVGLPPGVVATFSTSFVDVAPGAANFRDVTLTLTPQAGTAAATLPFTVTATSSSKASVTGTAAGTVVVVNDGVSVALDRSTGVPGDTFQMTVTNTGTVTDTYDLSLGGPAALVATLARPQVTLAPGASTTIAITTGVVTFAVPGALGLTAIAAVHGRPNVAAQDSATLTVPTTQGLAAQLTPDTRVLAAPGTASFLLEVHNTGNTEDSYVATIVGTSGPVSGQLGGLEGQPTKTIPLFRLPGLGSGAIVIDADLAAFGSGAVTVQVTSLSDGARTAMATARVSATQAVPTPTPTPTPTQATTQVVASPGVASVGQLVTFTATVAAATGNGTPSGTVIFTIDGQPQPPSTLALVAGASRATYSTTALAAGMHTVTATYSGSATFAASPASAPATVAINRIATATSLAGTPDPSTLGQAVTFTATITVTGVPVAATALHAAAATVPTGSIVFRDGALIIGVVPLDASGHASLITSALGVGTHAITATYSGDASFFASLSTPLVQSVVAESSGPSVVDLERFGYHAMPTTVVLTFDRPLDPTRASNPANYRIVGPVSPGGMSGPRVPLGSVVYDASTLTVSLHPVRTLNVHRPYRLTVAGQAPGGVTDTSGVLLRGNGQSGSDYVAVIDRRTLVFGVATPRFRSRFGVGSPPRVSASRSWAVLTRVQG